jgi:hypothetical protein
MDAVIHGPGEGERLGEREVDAGPGTFVCVPSGERYMRELADAGRAGPLTSEVIGRVASRHDFQIAG